MTTMTAPTEADATREPLTTAEITDGLDTVRSSPSTGGRVEMVVARPGEDERRMLDRGTFTAAEGLVGDDWQDRYPGEPDVEAQLTMINARFLDQVSHGDRERWPWAGDQVVVDLDLSTANLQPGDRLRLGTALVEVTAKPHTGCIKFVRRFGVDAQRFVNTDVGKQLRLRGIYVKVIEDGEAGAGDGIDKVDPT